ncbi:MAG TPA: DUF1816 domain-containing protein [Stenomitos sp.]
MFLTNSTIENQMDLDWWVEIVTALPNCTYYFGPFSSKQEADFAQVGYFEDLKQEGAHGITIQIKRCQPRELTTCTDVEIN